MRKLLAAIVIVGIVALMVPIAQAATPRFQIRCQTSHLGRMDPIVSPGQRSAHMHEFFGNTSTNSNSTYQTMIGQRTTCSAPGDTAGYWVPTLMTRSGQIVRASTILLYYRGEAGETTFAFPPDLRMVSPDSRIGVNASHFIIKFPDCWDGANLDSADHYSHMAKSSGKGCPASHPIRLPALTIVVRYPVRSLVGYTLSSGALSTMHADFWNTWDQSRLEQLSVRCLNDSTRSCPRIDG